ncbi:MAG: porin family protein [Gammaproteobacteria bacterium]
MKIKIIYLSVVLLCSGMSLAVAEPYIGTSLGFSDSDFCDDVDPNLDCDASGGAGKLFGGYKFIPGFGLELAYIASMNMSMSMSNSHHYSRPHITLSGLNFSAVGFLPVGEGTNLTAKIGMFSWQTKGSFDSYSTSESGSDLSLGVGVDLELNESFTLRGELDRFKIDNGSATLLSAGVMWNF